MDGGDPEVGGASVKQDGEVLRRGADADNAIVLGLGKKKKNNQQRSQQNAECVDANRKSKNILPQN